MEHELTKNNKTKKPCLRGKPIKQNYSFNSFNPVNASYNLQCAYCQVLL